MATLFANSAVLSLLFIGDYHCRLSLDVETRFRLMLISKQHELSNASGC